MKRPTSRSNAPRDWDAFTTSQYDATITPFVSCAEIYERFNSSKGGKKGSRGSEENEEKTKDQFGDVDSDLWNKGSKDFKKRRRESLAESKFGRRERKEPEKSQKETAPVKASDSKKSTGAKKGKNVGSEPGDRGGALGLRIIGGALRGTKLEYSGDHRVRPMKDRVREAIFNLLGDAVKDKWVVDLFAGTGALTLEAISRGASGATAIEIHFPTARITRRNVATVDEKAPGTAQKIELVTTDVFFWGRKFASFDPNAPIKKSSVESVSQASLPTDVPWLVFCSPPYDFFIDREEETLGLLRVLRDRAPSGSIFVVEADGRFDFDLLEADIPPKKRRSYPPAEVGIFTV